MDLVRELESYTGDPSNIVMSGSLSRSAASSSSGSTTSDDHPSIHHLTGSLPAHFRNNQGGPPLPGSMPDSRLDESSTDEEDEENDHVPPVPSVYTPSQMNRPQSSMSSRRYRTPAAGSLMLSPPPAAPNVPASQPLPDYHTESAFGEPTAAHSSGYPSTTISYQDRFPHTSATDLTMSSNPYPGYRAPSQQQQRRPYQSYPGVPARPASRPTLERAVENVQAALAALTERIETLEELAHRSTASLSSQGRHSPRWVAAGQDQPQGWDLDDMGMWTIAIQPVTRVFALLRYLLSLLAHSQRRSPTVVILRRLFLDISFMLCVLAVTRVAWQRSGIRRREVIAALGGLWRAVVGQKQPRILVDRAV